MRPGCLTFVLATTLGCASDPTPSTPDDPEPPVLDPVAEEPEAPQSGLGAIVTDVVEEARAADDLLLLPTGPTLLIGLDLAAFLAKPQWRTIAAQLGPREREQLRATEACGVGPDRWRRVLLGMAPPSIDVAILVEAEGLGSPQTLRCLHHEIGTFELADDAKTMDDATGGGIVLDDDTIVFATCRWMDRLRERLVDRGPPAYDGALKQATQRAGLRHAAWLGVVPSPELQALAMTTIGAELEAASGSIDTTPEGYVLRLVLTTPNPTMASLRIQGQLVVLEKLALANGLPAALLDAVHVEPQDGQILLELTATDQQVAELVTALRTGL